MKNYIFTVFALVIFTNLAAQEYYHKFYNFIDESRHVTWNFLIEEDDLLLKVGMDFCDIEGPCTPLLRIAKDNGNMKDLSYIDIASKFNKDALLRLNDQYYMLGNQAPFNNRPSVYIINDSLEVQERIEIDIAADHFLFVEWGGMVEREGYFYALANVLTNLGDKFGMISKFDANTFQHEDNIFVGREADAGRGVYDIQKDRLGNIYVLSNEKRTGNFSNNNLNIIYKLDSNDHLSVLNSYADFLNTSFPNFHSIDENNFVYSKGDFEVLWTVNPNDLLHGLHFEGDSLQSSWFSEFPFEEPNADQSNVELRNYFLYDIASAQNGDILACGTIEGLPHSPEFGGPYTFDIFEEEVIPIYYAGFITRFTKQGEFLWQRIFIFTNTTNPDVREGGFEFRGDLLQVAEDANGDIYAVGRKTVESMSGSGVPNRDSVWVVKTDRNGCLDPADCGREEVPTSVRQHQFSLDKNLPLSIYPNPVAEELTISSPLTLKAYAIHNALGLEMLSGTLDGKTIDVSKLSKGIYFLTVYTKDQKFKTEKIIKN